jgi:ornithine cyclodeaminase/alanine dehydrogenase
MDSTWLTAERTAAATAVAARRLAAAPPRTAAILGCGLQGRTNVEALRTVFPGLATLRDYDILPEALRRYADEMRARHGLEVEPCKNPKETLAGADIVVTCGPITANPERTIEPGWLAPGALAVTLDYDCYWTPAALAEIDGIFTDDVAQLEHLKDYGYFRAVGRIAGELGDVVTGTRPGRTAPGQKIMSINMGIALEDVAMARRIYASAVSKGRGTWLPW